MGGWHTWKGAVNAGVLAWGWGFRMNSTRYCAWDTHVSNPGVYALTAGGPTSDSPTATTTPSTAGAQIPCPLKRSRAPWGKGWPGAGAWKARILAWSTFLRQNMEKLGKGWWARVNGTQSGVSTKANEREAEFTRVPNRTRAYGRGGASFVRQEASRDGKRCEEEVPNFQLS